MKTLNAKTESVGIDRLTTHPRNPRRGDLEVIGESIEAHGFYGTIVAQKSTGHILAGNHRFMAAKAAGAEKVPVTWVDVDDETALRIVLVDNRASDKAHQDKDLLAEILSELGDLGGTGYDAADLAKLLESAEPPPLVEWDASELKLEAAFEIRCSLEMQPRVRELLTAEFGDAVAYKERIGER